MGGQDHYGEGGDYNEGSEDGGVVDAVYLCSSLTGQKGWLSAHYSCFFLSHDSCGRHILPPTGRKRGGL